MSPARAEPTVFVVDDDAAVRDALSLLIALKGMRTQVFASARDFLGTFKPHWHGCLLTDLRMPGMTGLQLQSALREAGVQLPVVFLTAHADVTTTREALKGGAIDFLEKPVDDDILVDVLQSALALDARRHRLLSEREDEAARFERLTSRERDVLQCLAEGLAHRDIAARLGISPRTVEVYKARMMEKLQCRSLADAVRASVQAGTARRDGEPG